MRKFIENNEFTILTLFLLLVVLKIVLFGYNLLGFYDFNDLFLR